jgi:hypothetical protein
MKFKLLGILEVLLGALLILIGVLGPWLLGGTIL